MGYSISVIIPFTHFDDDFRRTINSVRKWADEIIAINDGLKEVDDELPGVIICEYAGNKGVSYARNVGLERSTCDYILFLDCGDIVIDPPQIFSDYDICFFLYKQSKGSSVLMSSREDIREDIISGNSRFWICSTLFKRKFLIEYSIRFELGFNWAEDITFILDALDKAATYHVFNLLVTEKIENETSLTKDNHTNNISNAARFVLFYTKFGNKYWSKRFLVRNATHLLFSNSSIRFLDERFELMLNKFILNNWSALNFKSSLKFMYYFVVKR
jgi:glycosyltransferase involved in cell wall biosynthesis